MVLSHQWISDHFATSPVTSVPFSFLYNGKSSAEFLRTWNVERRFRKIDDAKTERITTHTDPATGLVLTCCSIEYNDFPIVEWTLYFKNTVAVNTPIIEDIQILNAAFVRPINGEFTLHYNKGDLCATDTYLYQRIPIAHGPTREKPAFVSGPR